MRFTLYFLLGLISAVLFAACAKDNSVETIDRIPTVEPTITEVPGNISILGVPFNTDTVNIIATQNGISNEVLGYNLIVKPELIGFSEIDFYLQWSISDAEPNIQEGNYIGEDAQSISLEGFNQLQEWFDNGADPDSLPTLNLEPYNASGINIMVRNLNLNTKEEYVDIPDPNDTSQLINVLRIHDKVDITLSGNLIDTDGNLFPLSGNFPATSSRIEF